jgi:hypothetical protein
LLFILQRFTEASQELLFTYLLFFAGVVSCITKKSRPEAAFERVEN